jgi:hypothetical protein
MTILHPLRVRGIVSDMAIYRKLGRSMRGADDLYALPCPRGSRDGIFSGQGDGKRSVEHIDLKRVKA